MLPPRVRLCAYCLGSGYITRSRACRCQRQDGGGRADYINFGHETGCDGGFVILREPCDWCEAHGPR